MMPAARAPAASFPGGACFHTSSNPQIKDGLGKVFSSLVNISWETLNSSSKLVLGVSTVCCMEQVVPPVDVIDQHGGKGIRNWRGLGWGCSREGEHSANGVVIRAKSVVQDIVMLHNVVEGLVNQDVVRARRPSGVCVCGRGCSVTCCTACQHDQVICSSSFHEQTSCFVNDLVMVSTVQRVDRGIVRQVSNTGIEIPTKHDVPFTKVPCGVLQEAAEAALQCCMPSNLVGSLWRYIACTHVEVTLQVRTSCS